MIYFSLWDSSPDVRLAFLQRTILFFAFCERQRSLSWEEKERAGYRTRWRTAEASQVWCAVEGESKGWMDKKYIKSSMGNKKYSEPRLDSLFCMRIGLVVVRGTNVSMGTSI